MNTVEPIRDLDKIATMKKILKATGLRNWLLFVLGINSALRVSDLLRLRQADVFDDRGRVLDSIRIREEKTDKEKLFPLNKPVKKALEEYIQTVCADLHGYGKNRYLFASRKGKNRPISRTQAWEIISSAAKAVGLKNIGTHTMRKTFGYQARQQGYGIEVLMKIFNHSNQVITLRYLGITQDDLDEVYINVNL
jgi:integrase